MNNDSLENFTFKFEFICKKCGQKIIPYFSSSYGSNESFLGNTVSLNCPNCENFEHIYIDNLF